MSRFNPHGVLLFTPQTLTYKIVGKAIEVLVGTPAVPCVQFAGATSHELYCSSAAVRDALLGMKTLEIDGHLCRFGALGTSPRSITIKNLPWGFPDDEFAALLAPYGDLLDWSYYQDDEIVGMTNGNRRVHIMMSTPVPNFLYVDERRIQAVYAGVELLCFRCGSPAHSRKDCPGTVDAIVEQVATAVPGSTSTPVSGTTTISNPVSSLSSPVPAPFPMTYASAVTTAAATIPVTMKTTVATSSLVNLPKKKKKMTLTSDDPAVPESSSSVSAASDESMDSGASAILSSVFASQKPVMSLLPPSSSKSLTQEEKDLEKLRSHPAIQTMVQKLPEELLTILAVEAQMTDDGMMAPKVPTYLVRKWCRNHCGTTLTLRCSECEMTPLLKFPNVDFTCQLVVQQLKQGTWLCFLWGCHNGEIRGWEIPVSAFRLLKDPSFVAEDVPKEFLASPLLRTLRK